LVGVFGATAKIKNGKSLFTSWQCFRQANDCLGSLVWLVYVVKVCVDLTLGRNMIQHTKLAGF
jgi:hypothetical protein